MFVVRHNVHLLRSISMYIIRWDTVYSHITRRYTPMSYDCSFVKFSSTTGLSARASYFEFNHTDATMNDYSPLDIDLREYTATPSKSNSLRRLDRAASDNSGIVALRFLPWSLYMGGYVAALGGDYVRAC
jgi:hypothetical protein